MEITDRGRLRCDDPLIADALNRLLGSLARDLIFDAPLGSLLRHDLVGQIAITAALGPLYLADLLEARPLGLIAGCPGVDRLTELVRGIGDGPKPVYHGPPLGRLPLTRSERRLLRAYVLADSLEAVARQLGIKKKTAANRLSLVKEKLDVKTHGQLLRAYFEGAYD